MVQFARIPIQMITATLQVFDVELLKEIERRNPDLHFNFKPMAVDAAFVAMDAGQVDMIANQCVVTQLVKQNTTTQMRLTTTPHVN